MIGYFEEEFEPMTLWFGEQYQMVELLAKEGDDTYHCATYSYDLYLHILIYHILIINSKQSFLRCESKYGTQFSSFGPRSLVNITNCGIFGKREGCYIPLCYIQRTCIYQRK